MRVRVCTRTLLVIVPAGRVDRIDCGEIARLKGRKGSNERPTVRVRDDVPMRIWPRRSLLTRMALPGPIHILAEFDFKEEEERRAHWNDEVSLPFSECRQRKLQFRRKRKPRDDKKCELADDSDKEREKREGGDLK